MMVMVMVMVLYSILQTQAGEGRVYKCLFNHKFEESMSEKVSISLKQISILFIFLKAFSNLKQHKLIPKYKILIPLNLSEIKYGAFSRKLKHITFKQKSESSHDIWTLGSQWGVNLGSKINFNQSYTEPISVYSGSFN